MSICQKECIMEMLTSKKSHPQDTVIHIGEKKDLSIGNGSLTIMAGPCAIESREQLLATAYAVKAAGAQVLRGGAFKPRTSPYTFSGLGEEGLSYLVEAGRAVGLPVISEIMDAADLMLFEDIDIIQVGAKNMQNFSLLTALGRNNKPVLLKRGAGNTIDELLYSAEYILKEGNPNVILCERGIRTFEPSSRFTFDINAIPLLKQKTHLPVIADPSHATGISSLVTPVGLAAIAAGCDGLLIEVHNDPASALCDSAQALSPNAFSQLVSGARDYEKIRCIHR
ncbi:3-deoxy-7-phosphoheptulonate synthase [Ihubacter sp. mB4P-1]|uniref:3-deoxy-7-phosphoheptulonate synthase n=1 Tax=Ihubacter sp. mB4P-1 TaxID=3242370 RepID=UPI003C7D14EC